MHVASIVFCVALALVGIPFAIYIICGSLRGIQQVKIEQTRLEHMRSELNRRSNTPGSGK